MMWRLSSIDARKNIHIQHFTQKGQRMIMKTRNEVHLTGGIVRIRASKSVTLLTIATTVAGVATAFPTIVFYEPKKTKGFEITARILSVTKSARHSVCSLLLLQMKLFQKQKAV